MEPARFTLSTSALVGARVEDSHATDLGKIEDLMLDRERGCVAYVVVRCGGSWGAKLVALPWPALDIDVDGGRIVVDIDREALENAPEIDEDHWPGHPFDRAGLREIYIYYGHSPYWEV